MIQKAHPQGVGNNPLLFSYRLCTEVTSKSPVTQAGLQVPK